MGKFIATILKNCKAFLEFLQSTFVILDSNYKESNSLIQTILWNASKNVLIDAPL